MSSNQWGQVHMAKPSDPMHPIGQICGDFRRLRSKVTVFVAYTGWDDVRNDRQRLSMRCQNIHKTPDIAHASLQPFDTVVVRRVKHMGLANGWGEQAVYTRSPALLVRCHVQHRAQRQLDLGLFRLENLTGGGLCFRSLNVCKHSCERRLFERMHTTFRPLPGAHGHGDPL